LLFYIRGFSFICLICKWIKELKYKNIGLKESPHRQKQKIRSILYDVHKKCKALWMSDQKAL
jgi:hypothetical protein